MALKTIIALRFHYNEFNYRCHPTTADDFEELIL